MPKKKTGEISTQAFCMFLSFLESILARKIYSEGEKSREILLKKMKMAYGDLSLGKLFSFYNNSDVDAEKIKDSLSFILKADSKCISAVNDTVMVGMLFFHNVGKLLSTEEIIAIKRESRFKELIFPNKEDLSGKALKKVIREYPLK